MTDNTPLNADDDGLDKAAQLLGIYLEEIDVDGYMPINVNRQTLANILSDRKKHELQTALKELKWAKTASVWNIEVRIYELEKELEKL